MVPVPRLKAVLPREVEPGKFIYTQDYAQDGVRTRLGFTIRSESSEEMTNVILLPHADGDPAENYVVFPVERVSGDALLVIQDAQVHLDPMLSTIHMSATQYPKLGYVYVVGETLALAAKTSERRMMTRPRLYSMVDGSPMTMQGAESAFAGFDQWDLVVGTAQTGLLKLYEARNHLGS